MTFERSVDDQIKELFTITAFQYGQATIDDVRFLIRLSNLLDVAESFTERVNGVLVNNVKGFRNFVLSIEARFIKNGSLTLTAHELTKLREFIVYYQEFWETRTEAFYLTCKAEIDAWDARAK